MDRSAHQRVNEAFDLLRNARRRYILYYLRNESATVDLDELAAQIADWEAGATKTNSDETTVESVRTTLRHSHLLKLANAGIITYEPNPGHIELVEAHETNQILDEIPIGNDPRQAADD